ncbi:hypothetical protein DERF_003106 [Dermatophagoides farinae]|uniref:Uncharacterized protein n=1 Tax=Dermatophagoides farinae TaxID=6954 RepID=A0A922LCD4_DERFA|nr:hypothetical protein DERF_003106 [Dermatophagoides farinae]
MDKIEVGPTAISLQLPSKEYTKQPMNDVYNPYCGGKPAKLDNAKPCGTIVNATDMPEMISPFRSSIEYAGTQRSGGNKRYNLRLVK